MTEKTIHDAVAHTLPNLGYIIATVPDDVREVIQKEVDNIQNGTNQKLDARSTLVGKLSEEYFLQDSRAKTEQFLFDLLGYYRHSFGYVPENQRFKLASLWVNFQKKYDYNPPHNHGGIFSFVIWVNVPYDLEDEIEHYSETKGQHSSMFSFYYSNVLGYIGNTHLPVSKEWEWKCAFFPAALNHGVYPFYTSDGTRISVSGNLVMI